MKTHVALLRGINVSGKKLVKMEHLRGIFESLEFQNVKTYIQSGNVIFDTKKEAAELICDKIEKELEKVLGFDVPVIIRTLVELEDSIKNNPFDSADSSEKDGYTTYLSSKPSDQAIDKIAAYKSDTDELRIVNREAYLLCPNKGYGETIYSNTFLEKKLGVSATTRNWKTINAIINMANS
jgi:uncharacterized protein (DUF1697 family)